jgi:cobalt/nickel transport system ATP-binding protein
MDTMSERAEMSEAMPAIECIDLRSGYDDNADVLSGVTIRISNGERVGLIGPNGAGKTTLLRTMVGVQPYEGTLRIEGRDVGGSALREVRMKTGLVFQNPDDQLFSPTIWDDVMFGPLAMGTDLESARRQAEEALDSVGMSHARDRNPLQLSFGERRLAAIAAVLSMRPSILAMDEPSSNLDPRHRRGLIDWLCRAEGYTLLLASHDLDMVAECCERVLVLDKWIVADGPTRVVLTDAGLLARHGLEAPLALQPLRFRGD